MNPWSELLHELDCWLGDGRLASFWWRDDDAVKPTPELDRLMDLSNELDVPLAVAVIPARADGSLARLNDGGGETWVLQHGFAHRNNAADGGKKIELGGARSGAEMSLELIEGRERLTALFGRLALPVMVPPWNRIDPEILALLPALGFAGLSGFAPRRKRAVEGLVTVNTHIDIIDWRGSRRFCGERRALDAAIGHLASKRAESSGEVGGEPTGLLTHHLDNDPECWQFTRRFVAEISAHPAARWISARAAFGAAP